MSLPSTMAAPRAARSAILRVDPPVATLDDVMLVVSELVTNAVAHAAPPVLLSFFATDGGSTVEVYDSTEGQLAVPVLERPDAPGGGRGLRIVSQVATAWGVRPFPGGKCVWATFGERAV